MWPILVSDKTVYVSIYRSNTSSVISNMFAALPFESIAALVFVSGGRTSNSRSLPIFHVCQFA